MSSIKKGFTLVELLVVVSIIGILTTLVVANLNSARERARDASRKSDLRNIQTALRLYYNDIGSFPAASAGDIVGCDGPCTWGGTWSQAGVVYMNTLPNDPLTDQTYSYTSDPLNDTFTLTACLENASDDKCTADANCESGCSLVVQP